MYACHEVNESLLGEKECGTLVSKDWGSFISGLANHKRELDVWTFEDMLQQRATCKKVYGHVIPDSMRTAPYRFYTQND